MTNAEQTQVAAEAPKRAKKDGDIVFLRRLRWGVDQHPKLNALLLEMHAAEEYPQTPIIEIEFQEARYYLMPEGAADFALRLYGDYANRRPPFTPEAVRKYYDRALNTEETSAMLEALLSGGIDPDDIPGAADAGRCP